MQIYKDARHFYFLNLSNLEFDKDIQKISYYHILWLDGLDSYFCMNSFQLNFSYFLYNL